LRLVIGNAVIGIVGVLILRLRYGTPWLRSIVQMVLANLASLGAGALLMNVVGRAWGADVTVRSAQVWLVIAFAALFALNVFVEWPFIAAALGRTDRRWWDAFRASLLLQTVAAALLVP